MGTVSQRPDQRAFRRVAGSNRCGGAAALGSVLGRARAGSYIAAGLRAAWLGARLTSRISGGRVLFNYAFDVDTFIAPSDATQAFHRWTVELNHEFPITRLVTPTSTSGAAPRGPNQCGVLAGGRCPAPAENRYGAVNIRLLASRSDAGSSARVPFYFQPTLGAGRQNRRRARAGLRAIFQQGACVSTSRTLGRSTRL